jgi:hypothetical protein
MEASQESSLGLTTLEDLGAAWSVVGHGPRRRAVLEGARRLRERLLAMAPVTAVRTLPITTLLYPTRYALWGAALSPAPFVIMTHRALLVRFVQGTRPRTLLFNPTDPERSRRTPFFARLIARFGERMTNLMVRRSPPLEAQLRDLGVAPEDIDLVAFDHFHTQDLRGLLGTMDGALRPRFPNATLLCPRSEWDDWDDLHPMQRAWFVPDGKLGVDTARVHFTHTDLCLGEGVLLGRTPGHTSGNQTLFLRTDQGVWGCSENGTCADNWSPRASRIPGVASHARTGDLDVLLNGNTVEGGADQYTSMLLEKTVVDPVPSNPSFIQLFPSSEVTPDLLAPGLSPSYVHGSLSHGAL